MYHYGEELKTDCSLGDLHGQAESFCFVFDLPVHLDKVADLGVVLESLQSHHQGFGHVDQSGHLRALLFGPAVFALEHAVFVHEGFGLEVLGEDGVETRLFRTQDQTQHPA